MIFFVGKLNRISAYFTKHSHKILISNPIYKLFGVKDTKKRMLIWIGQKVNIYLESSYFPKSIIYFIVTLKSCDTHGPTSYDSRYKTQDSCLKTQDTTVSIHHRASHFYTSMYQISTYIHIKRNFKNFPFILYMKQYKEYICNCLFFYYHKAITARLRKIEKLYLRSQTISKQHIKNALKLRMSTCATSRAYEERHNVKQIVNKSLKLF